MINRSKNLLVFVFCFGLFPAFSQVADTVFNKKDKSAYIVIGLGGSYANLLDQGISPLFYEGMGGGAVIGLLEHTEKLYYQSLIRFDFNNLSSEVSGSNIYSFRTEGLFDVFFKKWTMGKKGISYTPGLSVQYKWQLKSHSTYTNNSQNLQNSLKISPSLRTNLPFKLFKRDFTIGNIIRLPLINYTVRPIYASSKFPATYQKEDASWFDYLKGGKIYGWGNYFGLDAQTYLQYNLRDSKNALKLDYFWSYDHLRSANPVQGGQHSLFLSIIINL